jgi:hypothetical protein
MFWHIYEVLFKTVSRHGKYFVSEFNPGRFCLETAEASSTAIFGTQLKMQIKKRQSIKWHEIDTQLMSKETLKMAVFWVVAPCSLVEVYQRFRGPCCLHHQGDVTHRPDDGGSKDL